MPPESKYEYIVRRWDRGRAGVNHLEECGYSVESWGQDGHALPGAKGDAELGGIGTVIQGRPVIDKT